VGGRPSALKYDSLCFRSLVSHWANSAALAAPSPSTTTTRWPQSTCWGVSPAASVGRAIGIILSPRPESGDCESTADLPTGASSSSAVLTCANRLRAAGRSTAETISPTSDRYTYH